MNQLERGSRDAGSSTSCICGYQDPNNFTRSAMTYGQQHSEKMSAPLSKYCTLLLAGGLFIPTIFSTDEFSVGAPITLTGWREMLSVGSCKELCCCIHHKVSSSFLCFAHRGAVRVHWAEIHLAVSTLLTVSSSQLKSTADQMHPLVFFYRSLLAPGPLWDGMMSNREGP